MKTIAKFIYFGFASLALACFTLSPTAQAVVPAPDGGYAGGNTAEGENALFSLTSGGYNTAVGWVSLKGLTTGSFNTAVGAGTLLFNTADENTATGVGALLSNSTGFGNTANGALALFSNTEGFGNTAAGISALYSNTTGSDNTATGTFALLNNIEGTSNTAVGRDALLSNTADNNTAIGRSALGSNTTGTENTADGALALYSNTNGLRNTAIGFRALTNNNGIANTAIGNDAGLNLGGEQLGCTFIGADAGNNVTTASYVIAIGVNGANVNNSCFIGNIWQQSGGSQAVYVNASGKLGAIVSSRRFKDDIKPIEQSSEVIYQLRPVSFRYKPEIESAGTPGFGLIAEDVEKVNPALVVCDKDGQPYSVRYDQVNAMLLNEFLKEHRKVQEQEATIAQLKKDFRAIVAQLAARLDEQAAQIQKVSAQLEASKPAPQVVNNP